MTGREIPESVTRVDVVDQHGVHEFWGDEWEVSIQDDGRTLKLLQKRGYGAAVQALRAAALAKDLASYCLSCGGAFPSGHLCGRNPS